MSDTIITVYEPDKTSRKGYFAVCLDIYREITRNYWLIYQLFKRDFLAAYKQTVLGVFWTLILPLMGVGAFMLLSGSGLFRLREVSVPYPLYAVVGLTFWQLFSSGLVAASNSLVNAGPMIVKVNFSKKAIVIASLGHSLFSFLVQMFLAILLFFYYGIVPSLGIIAAPFLALPLLIFTLGLGFITSILNGIVRDVGNVLASAMTFLLFLTPVLYPPPSGGLLLTITRYNPLYYLVNTPRNFITSGQLEDPGMYLASVGLSAFIFLVCIFVFHLAETRITERM